MGERAGNWLRVSTTGQDETSQLPDITRWNIAHGHDVRRTFTVHGKSAFKGNRAFDQAWENVLDAFRTGQITVLVVWKQDRIDRKLNTFHMLAQVVELGGRVEFVTQPHLNDLTTMGGRIALKVQEEIAYAESKDKSDRILAKHANLRSQGSVTRKPPWGYKVTRKGTVKTFTPTDEARRVIPEMFTRVCKGDSLQVVAEWMTGETGHGFWARTIGDMIRNPCYIGYAQDGETTVKVEPLVSVPVFTRAGTSLANRPKRGKINPENRAMLAGVLFCPFCWDSPMYRLNTGYYRCTGRGRSRKGCGNMIPVRDAEGWVDEQIRTRWNRPIIGQRFVPGHNHDEELADIQYQLDHLPERHLDDDEEDRVRAYLRSERKRFAAMPAVPDMWEDIESDRTYADEWAELPACDRAEWLKRNRIVVMFSKSERGITIMDPKK